MPFNGSGLFTRLYSWAADKAANIKVRADRMDAEMDGFATGLTNCLTRDGQSPPSANLPMANFIHTGVGNATARTHYMAMGQAMNGAPQWVTIGGTGDAWTISTAIPFASYVAGMWFAGIAPAANTTAVTVNVDALGARDVVKRDNAALTAADIAANSMVVIRYDGTRFHLISQRQIKSGDIGTNQVLTAAIADSNVTTAKIADSNVTTGKVADNAVTNAKLADLAANTIKANATGATADPADFSVAASRLVGRGSSGNIAALTVSTGLSLGASSLDTCILAWAVINGTGTPSIFSQQNVASITDNGVGDYTINFTVALVTTNYCPLGTGSRSGFPQGATVYLRDTAGVLTGSACRIQVADDGGAAIDSPRFAVMFVGA